MYAHIIRTKHDKRSFLAFANQNTADMFLCGNVKDEDRIREYSFQPTMSNVKSWHESGGVLGNFQGKPAHFFDRSTMKAWGNRMSDFKVLCDRDQLKAYMNFRYYDGLPLESGKWVFFINRRTGAMFRVNVEDGSIFTAN